MRILMAQSCSLVDGCLTRTQRRAFAWGFVILFVATVLTALGAAAYAMRRERVQEKPDWGASDKSKEKPKLPDVYARAKPYAAIVKAVLQMFVGVVAVSAIGWKILFSFVKDPTILILNGIGIWVVGEEAEEAVHRTACSGNSMADRPWRRAG